MEYISLITTVALVHLLAVISPGPDFIMCVRNSLTYSRKTGIYTAIGFGLGIGVHILYSIAGLAFVISQSILLFNLLKWLGALYLIYIGIQSIRSNKDYVRIENHHQEASATIESDTTIHTNSPAKPVISSGKAIKIGFLTNALNPKATLFFLSLFTLVISPGTPDQVVAIASMVMIVDTILWFSLVATLLTHKRIRGLFEKYQSIFNKILGGALIALGIKVALSQR